MPPRKTPLPQPPERLAFEAVLLRFAQIFAGNPERELVPSYHFRIFVAGFNVGHINLRVGDTEHVLQYVGHIGFEVFEGFRGQRYAFQACRALAPFARSIAPRQIITCDLDNLASRRTIERLGATYLGQVAVPPHDPHYASGSRFKARFQWSP